MEGVDTKSLTSEIKAIAATEGNKQMRLINLVRKVQAAYGQVSDQLIDMIAEAIEVPRVEVEGVVSFYHFLTWKKTGKWPIYLNNSVVSEMMGFDEVARSFEEAAGISFGQCTEDGLLSLDETSCIGDRKSVV